MESQIDIIYNFEVKTTQAQLINRMFFFSVFILTQRKKFSMN